MRLISIALLVFGLILGGASPLMAQDGASTGDDEELVAPIPRPRPPELGGDPLPEGAQAEGTGDDVAAQPAEPDEMNMDEAFAAVASVTPQPVALTARVSEGGPQITEGLTWRVFDTKPDANGNLSILKRSDQANADFALPPGEYVVHVAYGRAQITDSLTVEPGRNQKSLILEAGALTLNASIVGDVPIPAETLRFTVYSNNDLSGEQTLVADNVQPGEMMYLNAGIYKVESKYGRVNATVRADIRVEPAQLTEATLYHRAAEITLKLVSEPGGEAIADTEWKVTDLDGTEIYTAIGAFGSMVLAEGEYTAIAQHGGRAYNLDFEVKAGLPREVEVVTSFN